MADLEDFLRKAAERRNQRQQGGNPNRSPSPPPQSQPAPVRQDLASSQEEALEPEIIEPEVIEAVVIPKKPRPIAPAPQRISDTPTAASTRNKPANLSPGVDQADEKMASHVKSALDHDLGKIDKRKKSQGKLSKKTESVTNQVTMVNRGQANVVGEDLLAMLRQPQTLKTAFIASEIFKRKFE